MTCDAGPGHPCWAALCQHAPQTDTPRSHRNFSVRSSSCWSQTYFWTWPQRPTSFSGSWGASSHRTFSRRSLLLMQIGQKNDGRMEIRPGLLWGPTVGSTLPARKCHVPDRLPEDMDARDPRWFDLFQECFLKVEDTDDGDDLLFFVRQAQYDDNSVFVRRRVGTTMPKLEDVVDWKGTFWLNLAVHLPCRLTVTVCERQSASMDGAKDERPAPDAPNGGENNAKRKMIMRAKRRNSRKVGGALLWFRGILIGRSPRPRSLQHRTSQTCNVRLSASFPDRD